MAVTKPTKAQVTALITTVAGVLILADTTLPISANLKILVGFIIGIIGIVGNVYGVYKTPNEISTSATPEALTAAASDLLAVASTKTAAIASAAIQLPATAEVEPVAGIATDATTTVVGD